MITGAEAALAVVGGIGFDFHFDAEGTGERGTGLEDQQFGGPDSHVTNVP